MQQPTNGTSITGVGEIRRKRHLLVLIGFQLALSLLYVVEYVSYYWVGYDHIPWEMVELYEISEGLFAFAGIAISISLIFMLLRRNREVETQLKAASGAFHQLMRERFEAWHLSPSEAEVALFTIKGLSNAEIARLRGTSEGTIKAQSNAIFRKAGVNNRTQLLGVFVEDLVGGAIVDPVPETRVRRPDTKAKASVPVVLDASQGLKDQ
jgi:DNA-binding CsgD family transcriptional regulator